MTVLSFRLDRGSVNDSGKDGPNGYPSMERKKRCANDSTERKTNGGAMTANEVGDMLERCTVPQSSQNGHGQGCKNGFWCLADDIDCHFRPCACPSGHCIPRFGDQDKLARISHFAPFVNNFGAKIIHKAE